MFNPRPPLAFPFTPTGSTGNPQVFTGNLLPAVSQAIAAGRPVSELGQAGDPVLSAPRSAYDPTSDEQDVLGLYREAAGFEREKLAQTAKQAKQTLDYQYAALKQQAKTAREQIEVDRWYKEQQIRLSEMTHALAVRAQDVSERRLLVDSLSSPDTMFQGRQMARQLRALNGGQTAPAYRAGGDMERPRTEADFYALPTAGGGQQVQAGQKAPSDGRIAAATGILKALPPSATPGLGARDGAAMRALNALYESPAENADLDEAEAVGTELLDRGPGALGLGQWESLLPGTRRALGSLARTRGINFEDWDAQRRRYQPGQGSALSA